MTKSAAEKSMESWSSEETSYDAEVSADRMYTS